ncbi:MAG TPA: ABC transporter permease subunit [Anaerolineales bacterium]|nr:ABC transporter permease subunit [Anaerolineales bacterium]
MIVDVWTIVSKEWRELLRIRGSLMATILPILVPVAVFGIFLPVQFGLAWVESPASLIVWGWMPPFVVMTIIADSFAGERERHTLETLLASRLPDRAILFGKIGAVMAYAVGLTVVIVAISVLSVNVAYWGGPILLLPTPFVLAGLMMALLISSFAAAVGILISLRASTVRQAQQILGFIMLFVFFLPFLALQWLPGESRAALLKAVGSADLAQITLMAVVVFVVLDVGLVGALMARFQRTRLILD